MAVTSVPKPGKKAERQRAQAEQAPKDVPKGKKSEPKPEVVNPYGDTSLGTNAIRTSKDAQLELPGERSLKMTQMPGIVTSTSLLLRQNLTIEEWLAVLPSINGVRQWTSWALGDALNFGERKFGEAYAQALSSLNYAEQTLNNFASVSHRVPPEVRRADLSWTHHEAVAKLKPADQVEWLEKAEKNGWSSQTLRDQIKEELGSARKPAAADTQTSPKPAGEDGTGAGPAMDVVRTEVDGEEEDGALEQAVTGIGTETDVFELTPQERAAKTRYERIAGVSIGFRVSDVPSKNIADLLMEGPAKALYDSLPPFITYLVDLHEALSISLGVATGDPEEDEETTADDAGEVEKKPVTV